MVFWWTRKPLITARAIIVGAILPADTSPDIFKLITRIGYASNPHWENPHIPDNLKQVFVGKMLLDPFAGFANIPLEGVRLGLSKVVAVELLPTAYVFLKAILEYPEKYGEQLVKDVEHWGKWILEKLREDPDIRELYDDDIAVYIGSWEVKCPHCGRYTPIVGNWWLTKVREGDKYKRLAFMKPVTRDNRADIEIVDLNKIYGNVLRAKIFRNTIEVGGERYQVPEPNINARRGQAICLLCQNTIRYIDPETQRHYIEKSRLPTMVKNRVETYIKYALKQWNNKLEEYLTGRISLEELKSSPARPRLLVMVKIKDRDLEFQPTTKGDNGKLWRALEELRKVWGDPDIPIEYTEPYCSSTYHTIVWGFDKFYKLFNPRQLLVLVKLVKLIREAGKRIEEERLEKGWSKEEAHRYAEAVTTYLAMKMLHTLEYNSIVTYWDPTFWGELKVKSSFAFRGIAMNWNWCEYSIVEGFTRFSKYIINGLSYLVSAVGGSPSEARVLLDDAAVLGKLGNERFDLIITDPPYYDDVPYSELSDFYYVWLKRTLSDNDGERLVPKFVIESFFRRVGDSFIEVSTQWESFAKREISFNVNRFLDEVEDAKVREYALERYRELLSSAFRTMVRHLSDEGILVTYYNHTNPDAWKDLLWAGWKEAGLTITAAWPLMTESPQAVTRRGKLRLDTSLVVVWRKRHSGREALASEVMSEALEEARRWAADIWRYHRGLDAFVGVMGRVLSVVTKYDKIVFPEREPTRLLGERDPERRIISEIVYPATGRALIEYLAHEYNAPIKSTEVILYILFKIMLTPPGRVEEIAKEKKAGASDMVILSLAASAPVSYFKSKKIIEVRRGGRGVEYVLLEPRGDTPSALQSLLYRKAIFPERPRVASVIDVLHVLEYYVASLSRDAFRRRLEELKYIVRADMVDEAINMAKILAAAMPEGDPEGRLCKRICSYLGLGSSGKTLFDYME